MNMTMKNSITLGFALALAFTSLSVFAGDKESHKQSQKTSHKMSHKEKESKEDIKREISFLAKKLLDMSGEERLVVKSDAVIKPFIGVCSMARTDGVMFTCITPGSQADKAGLKTGDVAFEINGRSIATPDSELNKTKLAKEYWNIVYEMKTGDLLKMKIMRGGEAIDLDVTVGSLSHPEYTLSIGHGCPEDEE